MKRKNNCPKCGAKDDWTDYQNWACGSNDKDESCQSELCETRQALAALKRDSLECIAEQTRNNESLRVRAEKAEAELAKREKALNQLAYVYNVDMDVRRGHNTLQTVDRLTARVLPNADNLPELAEWLCKKQDL